MHTDVKHTRVHVCVDVGPLDKHRPQARPPSGSGLSECLWLQPGKRLTAQSDLEAVR